MKTTNKKHSHQSVIDSDEERSKVHVRQIRLEDLHLNFTTITK